MPPLTWRNVDDPDLTKASRILEGAIGNFSAGATGISDTLQGVMDRRRRDASAALVPQLAGIQNSSQVDGVLNQISSTVDPTMLTPEMQAQLLAQRGQTADVDRVLASAGAIRGGEGREQTTFARGIAREDQLAAMAPELLRMQQEAYGPDVGVNNPNLSPAFRAEIGNIQPGESGGDYNKLFASSEGGAFAGIRPTEMTVDQWLEFQDPNGAYGQFVADRNGGTVSTPMGGYQIIGSTLRGAKKAMGLTGNEVMTPQMQDRIGQHIYETQGTGAWEGYNPNGPGANYVPNVAGLLPATGNTLLPADVMGLVDNLYTDRRTAINDQRTDRDDAYDFTREMAEDARTDLNNVRTDFLADQAFTDGQEERTDTRADAEATEAAQSWVYDQREDLAPGPEGMNAILESVLNDDSLSREETVARTTAITEFYGANAEYLALPGGEPISTAIDADLTQIRANADTAGSQDPLLNAVIAASMPAEGASADAEAAAAAGDGTSTEGGGRQSPDSLLAMISQFRESIGQAEKDEDGNYTGSFQSSDADMVAAVERVYSATEGKVDRRTIMGLIGASLTEDILGEEMRVDEDQLLAYTQQLTEPGALNRLRETARQREEDRQSIDGLEKDYREAMKTEAYWLERSDAPNDRSAQRAAESRAEMVRIEGVLAQAADSQAEDLRAEAFPTTEEGRRDAILSGAAQTQEQPAASPGSQMDAAIEARSWIMSDQAKELFARYPELAQMAEDDPLALYEELKARGMTPKID